MSNTIIFLSLLLIVLSLMLKINVILKYELLQNKIYIILKLFGIKIITIKLDVIGLFYEINNNKKIRKLEDIFSVENNYLIMEIKKSILDKLYYARCDVQCSVGTGNSADTAIVTTGLSIMCNTLSQYLDSKDIEFRYNNNTIFEYADFKIYVDLLVYFTIFDMVFALFTSFYKRGRYVKKTKRQGIKN